MWVSILQNEVAPVEKVAGIFRIAEDEDCCKYAAQMSRYR
jgi:hypothetical protein